MADIAAKPQPFLAYPGRLAFAWREWHRSFETHLIAAGCEKFTPRRKTALLKTFLGAEANRTAHMIESARPAGASDDDEYKYIVQGLAAHFDVSTSQRANRMQFRTASLVDQLVVGLASDRTRERLLTEGPALAEQPEKKLFKRSTGLNGLDRNSAPPLFHVGSSGPQPPETEVRHRPVRGLPSPGPAVDALLL
ncbi:hypothetical protein HPB48_021629 [Haemaphysalis longicornis]|uniref:Uncharacterized protein n=1 Tax=Haemaphysalis longicornis TaxID=44386 RepID=A0A9J6FQ09_HAELO|nr:hypothetical protein HPB48_021629 [Haemaphysalis longicornis]